ncbi:MAG: hypothetical protein ACOX52_20615 [Verrucomicrobiota bacterium]
MNPVIVPRLVIGDDQHDVRRSRPLRALPSRRLSRADDRSYHSQQEQQHQSAQTLEGLHSHRMVSSPRKGPVTHRTTPAHPDPDGDGEVSRRGAEAQTGDRDLCWRG